MSKSLRFRPDGSFKIVQFTDLHWKNGGEKDKRTRTLMERILEEERPDFIVFTGDVIESLRCNDPLQSYRDALTVAAQSGIQWASVFGNHDCEGNVSKERLMDIQLGLPGTVAESGPANIAGVGNFVATIADSSGKTGAALYFLDSGAYSELPAVPGYDWIRFSQIEWFREQAAKLKEQGGGVGVPGLVFFHIPLPEYREVWDREVCRGHRYEKVHSPKLNSGFFAAMVQSGSVVGAFCGHDHINDYAGTLRGIKLCYGRATGYNTYGRWLYRRGARVIQLRLGEPGFETWLRLAGGKKVVHSRKHFPNYFSRA